MHHRLVVAFFALFLTAPWLAAVAGVRAEAFENRALAARPEWEPGAWLDVGWHVRATAWLNDRMPLRAQAVRADSWIDWRVFGDSPSPEVLAGRDDWLFLTDALRWPCDGTSDDAHVLAGLERIGLRMAERGIRFVVAFSPDKAFLHADRLPPAGRALDACAAEARTRLRKALAGPLPYEVAPLWDAYASAAARGETMFPRFGRHASPRADVLQAHVLIEALAPDLWDPGAVRSTGVADRAGELPRRFMNLSMLEPIEGFRVERPGVTVRSERPRLGTAPVPIQRRDAEAAAGVALVPGTTVVLHDSFLEGAMAMLAPYFERVDFIPWNVALFEPERVAERVVAADRVVFQVVEDRRHYALPSPQDRGFGADLVARLAARSEP